MILQKSPTNALGPPRRVLHSPLHFHLKTRANTLLLWQFRYLFSQVDFENPENRNPDNRIIGLSRVSGNDNQCVSVCDLSKNWLYIKWLLLKNNAKKYYYPPIYRWIEQGTEIKQIAHGHKAIIAWVRIWTWPDCPAAWLLLQTFTWYCLWSIVNVQSAIRNCQMNAQKMGNS